VEKGEEGKEGLVEAGFSGKNFRNGMGEKKGKKVKSFGWRVTVEIKGKKCRRIC